ncbi:transcriptional regulator, TetR family [Geomicrobium sp. JCM 19037]|uniref:TetR/AcrR family transcriptional regulator n=1 Tax=unclassified Geomicrobium TaxID=2628951 RepID=UPI00045F256F|nr:TetR/AcrR family transcriptional regulator [Geomicrobium sp. JCM 19037]GAK04028.1 transcriptional regulator, TetR family [Geomicrobium sp. JCM 19037]
MPKIVDHDQRRKQIAETTWEVIRERGISQATTRNIASRAGLSQGALRHYFPKHTDLMMFAMDLVIERVTERLQSLDQKGLAPLEKVVEYLTELLPTNDAKMLEMEVWFAFVSHARSSSELDVQYGHLQTAVKDVIVFLDNQGILHPDLNVAFEQEKLYAFINGLALNLYLEPGVRTESQIKEMIVDDVKKRMVNKERTDD